MIVVAVATDYTVVAVVVNDTVVAVAMIDNDESKDGKQVSLSQLEQSLKYSDALSSVHSSLFLL